MAEQIEIHENRLRAESFGSIAANYDRFRPSYPPALIDAIMAIGPTRILDVGCGTGKAAVLFAARGVDVLGVEIDERMAEVARGHAIPVEVGAFETWDDAGRTFDMIISGQAWHWVDPSAGTVKAAKVLRPGGTMALFWNTDIVRKPLGDRITEVYREHAPEIVATIEALMKRHRSRPYVEPIESSGLFAQVRTQYFESERTISREDWVGLVSTHSDHVTLEPARRERLLAAAARVIDEAGGVVPIDVTSYLLCAVAPSAA